MRRTIILLLLALIIFGCKKENKEKDKVVYNYHGYIYKLSDSTPYTNTSFVCYQGKPRTSVEDPQEEIVPFTTDGNGYFSIDITPIGGIGTMVCWPDHYSSYEGCPEHGSYLPKSEYDKYSYDAGVFYMP